MDTKLRLFLAALLSGFLMFFAWPVTGLVPVIFISWVPLLLVEYFIRNNATSFKKFSLFVYSYPAFLLWNILTTWWVYNASAGGAIMAIFCNALLMSFTFGIINFLNKHTPEKFHFLNLASVWISFEYLHHNWDITWPWLTLGNVFATLPDWVQWYEYTGPFGGTLWVLAVNYLLFALVKNTLLKKQMLLENKHLLSWMAILVMAPISISYVIKRNYSEEFNPVNVVIVQPNIDPYNEKFSSMSQEQQLVKALQLASTSVDNTTDFVVCPETSLPIDLNEDFLDSTNEIKTIRSFLTQSEKLNVLMGISTYRFFKENEKPSLTARAARDGSGFYDVYNTAALFNNTKNIQLYHKSKLVPGVEKMPFPSVFKYIEKFAISLGGTSGSLGTQEERTILASKDGKFKAAPVICYESIYAGYCGGYIKNGANFISIITNDGWWGDTPGYKQHINYARLLAIEHRRSIARSANTGISATINQTGEIVKHTYWWQEDVIKDTINANNKLTFYSKFGDYIAILMAVLCLFLIPFTVYKSYSNKRVKTLK